MLVPVYQAECAPKAIRGAIISAYQLFIAIGLLVAAIVVDATKHRPDDSSYRIPIAIQFAWAAIIGGGVLLLPESPRFLLMKNRTEQGRRALCRLLGKPEDSDEVRGQYAEMMANLEHDRKFGKSGWAECFKMGENKALLRIMTGIVMQAFNQLSGVSA